MAPDKRAPSGLIQLVRSRKDDTDLDAVTASLLDRIKKGVAEEAQREERREADENEMREIERAIARERETAGLQANDIEVKKRKRTEQDVARMRMQRDQAIAAAIACEDSGHQAAIDRLAAIEPALPALETKARDAEHLKDKLTAVERAEEQGRRRYEAAEEWTQLHARPDESSIEIEGQREGKAGTTKLRIVLGRRKAKLVWDGLAVIWVGNRDDLRFYTDPLSWSLSLNFRHPVPNGSQVWQVTESVDYDAVEEWISRHDLWVKELNSQASSTGGEGKEDAGAKKGRERKTADGDADADADADAEEVDVEEAASGEVEKESEEEVVEEESMGAFSIRKS